MNDSAARVLTETDWQVLRDVRLEALRESPDRFVATYDEEAQHDEQFWRDRTRRARWLVAERDGKTVAVVGLGTQEQDPEDGEIFGLWVSPEVRRSRVGWDLVQAAVKQAIADALRRLYFWVGSHNGPAVAFASAIGFRPTSKRRPGPDAKAGSGAEEVAMVLALTPDPTSVVNPRLA